MKRLPTADLDHIFDHTRDLWEELRGERIFITGGTGFFGKWLVESLLWANDRLNLGCQATVLTRDADGFRSTAPHLADHAAVSVIQGDVRNFVFPPGTFSHIIHAATESSEKLNQQDPLLMLDTIVQGTRHTLDLAKSCGAKKFLLTSSGAVYGTQPSDLTHVPETYNGAPNPQDPKSAYGEGKRLAEYLCSVYANANLEPKIARGFAFVGPHLPLDIHFAIGNFIRDAMNGGPILIKGDGTPHRSYLYMADLAIWLWTILIRGQALRPYNVGSDQSLSIREIAERVAACVNPGVKVEILGVAKIDAPVERYVPSVARAQNELGLHSWFTLERQVGHTVAYYQSNQT